MREIKPKAAVSRVSNNSLDTSSDAVKIVFVYLARIDNPVLSNQENLQTGEELLSLTCLTANILYHRQISAACIYMLAYI